MERLIIRVRRFFRSDDGPTAVEYAVILALILLVCVASIGRFGRRTRNSLRSTARSLAS